MFFNHVHPFFDDGELIDKSQSIQRHYEMLEYLVDGSTVNISCRWTSKKTQSFPKIAVQKMCRKVK